MCTKEDYASASWCGTIHPTSVFDRLATKTPRTKYKADGIGLGAYVSGIGSPPIYSYAKRQPVTGQVWAQAAPFNWNNRGYWWVVDSQGQPWIMHDSSMTVEGHALVSEDVPLFEDVTA